MHRPVARAVARGRDLSRPVLSLDNLERVVVAALYAGFVFNIFAEFLRSGNYANFILLANEGAVLVIVLMRRKTSSITALPRDWMLGFAGTTLPLLVLPDPSPPSATLLMALLMICGGVLELSAKLTLRRSFGIVAANRGVVSRGPYRFIRHPMYAGYILAEVGFLLANPTGWNTTVYCLVWACQLGRILREEGMLMGDPAYRALAERVRWRLVPGLF